MSKRRSRVTIAATSVSKNQRHFAHDPIFSPRCRVCHSWSARMAQQPPGITQTLNDLADQPATHVSFTFDRSMLEYAESFIDNGDV